MRLEPGRYFGVTLQERPYEGMLLTLSAYGPGAMQPWHVHDTPTLYLLLDGEKVIEAANATGVAVVADAPRS